MEIKEGLKWNGEITFQAFKDGKLVRERKEHNKVTNYARAYMAQMLVSPYYSPVIPSQIELGTGAGTPQATDTDLWSPAVSTLKPCSNSQVYLSYFAQFICTYLTSDPIVGTWTEVGLKDANNNLWAHAALPSGFPVYSGEMLVVQWQIQFLGN